MSRGTPGPWAIDMDCVVSKAPDSGEGDIICLSPDRGGWVASAERWEENAPLLAAARAMDLALSLIASGAARIEPARGEPGQNGVRAFCFDGSRYILDGDWNGLFEVIGWDKAIAAVGKAQGAQA